MSDLKIEDVAEVVKSHVEDKVTAEQATEIAKSAVEAVEVPSVEGFAKSEDMEAAMAAVREELATEKAAREELEAVVKSAPAIITKKDSSMDFSLDNTVWKADTSIDFSEVISKAFTSTGSSQIGGSTTGAARVYHAMEQRNPFRMLSTVMPTTSGAVNLPRVQGIAAINETTLPLASLGTTSTTGNVTNAPVVPQNWASRALFSDQSLEDLPSLDQMVAALMAQEIAVQEAQDMVAQLDAATVTEVDTGSANALPTSLDEWAELVATLSSAYKGNAKFVMSREALQNLRTLSQSGTGSDLVISPSDGMFKLWGYDIIVNDHVDAGSADGQNPVYFGDFSMGTIIIARKEMQIGRHEDTVPGGVYYYGNMRSRGTVWDASALVRFNVGS